MKRILAVLVVGAVGALAYLAPAPVVEVELQAPSVQYPAFSTDSAFCPTWQSDNAVDSRVVAISGSDFTGRWFFDGDELAAFAGNGDDPRSWSADPSLQQGFTPVHLFAPEGVVSGGVRSTGTGFDAGAVCTRVGASDWVVGVGSTLEGHQTALMLYNPFPQSATVEVEIYSEQNLEVLVSVEQVVVPPRTLRRFELEGDLRLRQYLVFVVREPKGRIVPSLETVSPEGSRAITTGAALSPRWFFPAGGTAGSTVELVLVNPSVAALSVVVDFLGVESAELGAMQLVLPARSSQIVEVPAEVAVALNSDGSIGAALRVSNPLGTGITTGTQSVATSWVLPGLSRGAGLEQAWILNPGAVDLTVSYELYGAGGVSATQTVSVPAGRVLLVPVGATNSDSVLLSGDSPFVAGWTAEAPRDTLGFAVETGVPHGG